jgi:hypothetical protein
MSCERTSWTSAMATMTATIATCGAGAVTA